VRVPNPHLYLPIEFRDEDLRVHVGTSWADLIDKVRDYRARVSKPPGNPEQEIFEQVCKNNPGSCRETSADRVLPTDDLHKRILRWLSNTAEGRKKLRFVSEALARERAAICAGCPRLRGWRGACGTCAASADKIMNELLKGKTHFDQPRGCGSLREDPRVSVWLDQPPVLGNLPANCWRKA